MSKPPAQRVGPAARCIEAQASRVGSCAGPPQLPDDENPRLVDPKPPRDVDELDVEPEVDLKPTLPEAGLVLPLVDFVGDSAVETEPDGRFDVDRGQSEDDERELQFQLPQERRRRHGSSCAAPGGAACWAGCAAAGCGRHSPLRAGIM